MILTYIVSHDMLHDHLHLHAQYWKRHFIFVSDQIFKRSQFD